jgi:hypothetical protein
VGSNGTFELFCGPDAYGVAENIVQSGIALFPLENATESDRPIVSGTLRPLLFMHETFGTVNTAPSVSWPDNFAAELASLSGNSTLVLGRFFSILTGLVAATSGSVTVFPDFTGMVLCSCALNCKS